MDRYPFTVTDLHRLPPAGLSRRTVAQSHTPQACCVRFGLAVTSFGRNTRYQADRYSLPERDLPPLDRADFAQRTATSSESAAKHRYG